jgi:exodeoxyribonuclease-3
LKLATFNINGIRSRLPRLLEWLERESPDIVCLQELKAIDGSFPAAEIRAAGYGALWHGQKSWNGVAILAKDAEPIESRRGLPGDAADVQSRYIEAAVDGIVVCCLYLPNGNPQPGPKFDYKLAWFERLRLHANSLRKTGAPVVLAGDYNVAPTEIDIYPTKSWDDDALIQPESRAAFKKLLPGTVWAATIYPADEGVSLDGALVRDLPPSALDKLHPQTHTQRASAFKVLVRTTAPAKRVVNGSASTLVRVRAK